MNKCESGRETKQQNKKEMEISSLEESLACGTFAAADPEGSRTEKKIKVEKSTRQGRGNPIVRTNKSTRKLCKKKGFAIGFEIVPSWVNINNTRLTD